MVALVVVAVVVAVAPVLVALVVVVVLVVVAVWSVLVLVSANTNADETSNPAITKNARYFFIRNEFKIFFLIIIKVLNLNVNNCFHLNFFLYTFEYKKVKKENSS